MTKLLLSHDDQMHLLGELCVTFGFCSLSGECQSKLASAPLTVDEFIDTVMRGEGYDRELWKHELTLRERMREVVATYYDRAASRG